MQSPTLMLQIVCVWLHCTTVHMREYANHLLHMCNHVLIPPKIIRLSSSLFVLMASPRCMNALHHGSIGDRVGDRVSRGALLFKELFHFIELCMLISEVLSNLACDLWFTRYMQLNLVTVHCYSPCWNGTLWHHRVKGTMRGISTFLVNLGTMATTVVNVDSMGPTSSTTDSELEDYAQPPARQNEMQPYIVSTVERWGQRF